MAEQGPPGQNDGAPAPAPAEGLPMHPVYHRGNPNRGKLEQAANVIPRTEVTPGDVPVVAICPYCGANLSKHSIGRYVQGPQGVQVDALFPLQCHECNHPLLYMKTSGIITTRDLPR